LVLTTTSGVDNIVTNRTFLPNADNTLNLGSPTARFANVYAANMNVASYNSNTVSSVDANLLLTTPQNTQTVTTNRHFTPTVNNTQTLGTSALKWSAVYGTTGFFGTISNNNNPIITNGGLEPNIDDSHRLGDDTKRFAHAYVTNIFTNSITSLGTSDLTLTTPSTSQVILSARSIRPTADDTFLLGSTNNRWANIYGAYVTANNVQSPGSADLLLSCLGGVSNSIRCQTNLVPDQTDLFNSGSATLRWNNSYINNTFTNTLRGTVGAITLHNSLVPTTNNSLNLGSGSFRLNTVHSTNVSCSSLQNQSGTDITCSENFNPTANDTYNLGTSTLKWNNGYFANGFVDSLKEATLNAGIVVSGSIRPFLSIIQNLGSATNAWKDLYVSTAYLQYLVPRVGSDILVACNLIPSGFNLNLGSLTSPFDNLFVNTLNILTSFLPAYPAIYDLGSALQWWGTGFFDTVRTNILQARNGNVIYVPSNIVPSTNNTVDIGSSSYRYNNIYASNLLSPQSQNIANLSFGPETVGDQWVKRNVVISGGGSYWAGNYQFKFPTKGYYMFRFETSADTELLQLNNLKIQLYHVTEAKFMPNPQYHQVGGANNTSKASFSFYYECLNTSDRIEIYMSNTYLPNFITNVQFLEGSRIVRLLTYP
jgi:hypothetical protein